MALGTVIALDLNFSGAGAGELPQIVYKDFLESSGSMMLVEARHPMEPLPSGVPTHGSYYQNILADTAAKMLGSDTRLQVQSVYASASEGKVERSARGGIHAIQSKTQTLQQHGFSLRLPSVYVEYLRANPTHDYYVSQWGKTTQPYSGSQHAVAAMTATGGSSFAFMLGNGMGVGQERKQGRQVSTETANSPTFRNTAAGGFHSDFITGTVYPQSAALFEVGNFLAPNAGTNKSGTHGAQIFYRGYMEDLTVSGRTYEQVDALDFAEYTKQVLTVGGRYYNDTVPTNPASIP